MNGFERIQDCCFESFKDDNVIFFEKGLRLDKTLQHFNVA